MIGDKECNVKASQMQMLQLSGPNCAWWQPKNKRILTVPILAIAEVGDNMTFRYSFYRYSQGSSNKAVTNMEGRGEDTRWLVSPTSFASPPFPLLWTGYVTLLQILSFPKCLGLTWHHSRSFQSGYEVQDTSHEQLQQERQTTHGPGQ